MCKSHKCKYFGSHHKFQECKGVLRSKSLRTAAIIHSKLQAGLITYHGLHWLCAPIIPRLSILHNMSCWLLPPVRDHVLIWNLPDTTQKKDWDRTRMKQWRVGMQTLRAQKKTHGWWLFLLQCHIQISFLEAHLNSYVYLKTVSSVIYFHCALC